MDITRFPGAAQRLPSSLLAVATVALLTSAAVFFLGSSNPVTPAGYVGYVTRGAIFAHENSSACRPDPLVQDAAGR